MTIKVKMQMRIKRSKRYVFMRDDFNDIANYDQIGRVLRNLVQEGELIKVGYGIYTKARKNQITGKVMPACPEGADAVILEALKRFDVQVMLGDATEKYLSGQSTQIPAFTQIKTPRRFTLQLSLGRSQLMPDIKNLFADVADALGIGATSIVEKDYYVVELLRLLQSLEFKTHDLVFAGGTSLAKANIQLNRMSEDVDIKIVPKLDIALSRSKAVRKNYFIKYKIKFLNLIFLKLKRNQLFGMNIVISNY